MKKQSSLLAILFAIAALLSIHGCKESKYVPIQTKTIVRDREVRVPVPADSSSYWALLSCDSANNVLLLQLHETKTGTIDQSFELQNNILTTKFKSQPVDVKTACHDSIIEREIPYPVPGEDKIIYKMTFVEKLFFWLGIIETILVIAYILYIIYTFFKWMKK